MKSPLTLTGIETATFRFVAQHLNHCATAVPNLKVLRILNISVLGFKWNLNPNIIEELITDPFYTKVVVCQVSSDGSVWAFEKKLSLPPSEWTCHLSPLAK